MCLRVASGRLKGALVSSVKIPLVFLLEQTKGIFTHDTLKIAFEFLSLFVRILLMQDRKQKMDHLNYMLPC